MENQHRLIAGYRELTEPEIAVMNSIKEQAQEVGRLVDALREMPQTDMRWVAIGATDLQKGFMSLVRAVSKPEGF